MTDSFQGTGNIELRPGSSKIPVLLKFPVATGTTLNDGAIPFGSTITSVTASILSDRNVSSTKMISAISLSSHTVTVSLDYNSTYNAGLYNLKLNLTVSLTTLVSTSTAMIRPFNLNRIIVYAN